MLQNLGTKAIEITLSLRQIDILREAQIDILREAQSLSKISSLSFDEAITDSRNQLDDLSLRFPLSRAWVGFIHLLTCTMTKSVDSNRAGPPDVTAV